jgi:1,4-dihydroxy-2-naphthoate octaprenyltransferase
MSAALRTLAALGALARPRLLPWMLGIVLFGYGFVHWDQSLYLVAPGGLALLLVAWSLGHAGTMWLNAALDREEDGVLFARPVPVPAIAPGAAYLALAAALAVAAAVSPRAALCVGGCALLAVAYSHPRLAWKGHPLAGPLVNVLGYGILSPLAGATVATATVSARFAVTLALWSLWLFGAYLAAQAFQEDDDRRRGYRTFVVEHGPAVTLRVARRAMNGAVLGALGLTIAGVYPRWTLLAYPGFVLADRWMARWQRAPRGGGPRWAAGLFQRMLGGGLAVFALAWLEYWFG